jgi:septum formation protein
VKFDIILASASPRRKALLSLFIKDFTVISPNIDETFLKGVPVESEIKRIAQVKTKTVYKSFSKSVVIGADTIVETDGKILGKPNDKKEAKQMLSLLNGRTHRVRTCVCVMWKSGSFCFTESTTVKFRDLSDGLIELYIDSGEPFDKAGGYGIQGLGAMLVERIDGDYNNAVGLPVGRLMYELTKRDLVECYINS